MADEPELQKGQSGEWVGYLQQLLAYAGYSIAGSPGEFDDQLEQTVMQYQGAMGLPSDGIVNAATWDALTGASSAAGSGQGSGTGGADGGYDPGTGQDAGAQHGEANEHDPDSVYIDTAHLPITMGMIDANGDLDTYLASIGIDANALTHEAIA